MAGDYTVTASGVTFAEGKESGNVKVEAQKIASLEIVGDNIALTATGAQTATVNYIVKDQYGTDVTKEALAANLTWTASSGTSIVDDNQGKATWNKGAAIVTGTNADTVTLTVFDSNTTTTAAKKLTAVAPANINTFEFVGEPVVPTGATRLTSGQNDVVFNYTASNQYGAAVELTKGDLSQLQFMSSDNSVVDGASADIVNKKLTFDFKAGLAIAKEVTITAINKNTGATSQIKFTVNPVADAAEPTIVPPTASLGAGATGFKVYLNVADQYGRQLTADEIVAAGQASKFQFSSTNTSVLTVQTDGKSVAKDAKGAYVPVNAVGTAGQTATLSFTITATSKVATQSFTIVAAKAPAAMTLVPASTSLTEGASSVLKATFVDQYGDAITTGATYATYKVKFTSSDTSVAAAPAVETLANMVATGKTVTALAGSAGKSTTITAELFNDANSNGMIDAGELVDTKTVTYSVTNATQLTYSMSDIPKLYAATSPTTNDIHAKEIKVVAKDASGNTVAIPASAIQNVTTEDATLAIVGKATGGEFNGKYVVVGNKAGLPTGTTTKDVKIRALVNTGTDIVTVEKVVTVSLENLVATTIKVLDGAADVDGDKKDDEMTAPAYTFTNATALKTGIDLLTDSDTLGQPYVRVYDQFGVAAPSLNSSHGTTEGLSLFFNVTADGDFLYGSGDGIAVTSTDGGAGSIDTATVKLTDVDGNTTFKAGATFKVVVTTSNGLSKTINFTVTAGNGPTAIDMAGDVTVKGGANVSLSTAPAVGLTAWLAPDNTTSFAVGSTMTKLVGDGTATTIVAPANEGVYYVYTVDAKGNASKSTKKVTVDNTAPAFAATYPQAATGAGASKDLDFKVKQNEDGNVYYVVLAKDAAAPTAAQVKAGKDAADGAVTESGSIAVTKDTEATKTQSAALADTDYDIYFVGEDAAGNLGTVVKVTAKSKS